MSSFTGPLEIAFDRKDTTEFRSFPSDVQNLVNGGIVKIKNRYFNSYLKLDNYADWAGDRGRSERGLRGIPGINSGKIVGAPISRGANFRGCQISRVYSKKIVRLNKASKYRRIW